jgi:hypothetical protein
VTVAAVIEKVERQMDWEVVKNGLAKYFVLEDGSTVVGLLAEVSGIKEITFYTNQGDLNNVGVESEKLGGLGDMIEKLEPGDIIEICGLTDGP